MRNVSVGCLNVGTISDILDLNVQRSTISILSALFFFSKQQQLDEGAVQVEENLQELLRVRLHFTKLKSC